MIDLVANYWISLRKMSPVSDAKPGFINKLVPQDALVMGESWEEIFNDIDEVVINCNTHWYHPKFFAYYGTGVSYQSIMGDILSSGLAGIGFTWALELPAKFLNTENGYGLGMIQSTASDATYMAILTARGQAIERIRASQGIINEELQVISDDSGDLYHYPYHDATIMTRLLLTARTRLTHQWKKVSCSQRTAAKVKNCTWWPFDNFGVTAEILEETIMSDRKNGLVPFTFIMTLGTTSSCGMDPVDELGPVCQRENIWIHIDSAYADN